MHRVVKMETEVKVQVLTKVGRLTGDFNDPQITASSITEKKTY